MNLDQKLNYVIHMMQKKHGLMVNYFVMENMRIVNLSFMDQILFIF